MDALRRNSQAQFSPISVLAPEINPLGQVDLTSTPRYLVDPVPIAIRIYLDEVVACVGAGGPDQDRVFKVSALKCVPKMVRVRREKSSAARSN